MARKAHQWSCDDGFPSPTECATAPGPDPAVVEGTVSRPRSTAAGDVPGRRPLVVGVDGSCGGRRALEWALGEALLRGSGLRVVTVWTWEGHGNGSGSPPDTGRGERTARQIQQVQLARALARVGAPLPAVEAELAQGDPASRLMESSCDADLLVLGSRGNSALHDTLMGSVAEVCVRHATCPVVVVPHVRQVVLPCRGPVRGIPHDRP